METGGGNTATPSRVRAATATAVVTLVWLLGGGCRSDEAAAQVSETLPGGAPSAACGRPPLQSCPLQQWMDANLASAFREGRMDRMVGPLETLAAMAPPEYASWKATALAGAAAAAHGDRNGVRDSCGSCHDTYRAAYRTAMRARPLVATRATAATTRGP